MKPAEWIKAEFTLANFNARSTIVSYSDPFRKGVLLGLKAIASSWRAVMHQEGAVQDDEVGDRFVGAIVYIKARLHTPNHRG